MNLTLHFVFDIHETLITNTREELTEAINRTRRTYGLPPDIIVDAVAILDGEPLETYAKHFFPEKGNQLEDIISRIVSILPELDKKYLRAMDGAEEVLKHIKAEGDLISALSNSLSPQQLLWEQLRMTGLADYLTGVFSLSEGRSLVHYIKNFSKTLESERSINRKAKEQWWETAKKTLWFYSLHNGHKAYAIYTFAMESSWENPVQVIAVGDSPLDVTAVEMANKEIKAHKKGYLEKYGIEWPLYEVVSVLLDPHGEKSTVKPDYRIKHLTEIIEKYPAIKEKAGTLQTR